MQEREVTPGAGHTRSPASALPPPLEPAPLPAIRTEPALAAVEQAVPPASLVVGTAAYFVQRVLVLGGQSAIVVAAVLVAILGLELLAHL